MSRFVRRMKMHGLSVATRVVILTAFYFLGGLLGKKASFMSGTVELVWPHFGIGLAAILLFGYHYWPGVAAGAILCSMLSGDSLGVFTIGTAVGNTIGAVLCAWLLERIIQFRPTLERVRDVAGFVGLACLLGTTVNAAFNVVSLCFEERVPWDEMFSNILEWWVPNAMAGLVVTPAIISWGSDTRIRWTRNLVIEGSICAACLIAGTMVSFNSWYVYGIQTYPLAYLPYPFLVWGSLRFGQRGATTGTLLVSSLAIYALLDGRGPFVTHTERESLMLVGSYIGILAITNMLLAAVAKERETAEMAVRESEQRYRAVVEDQTDLIWRFRPDGTLTFVNEAYCRFHSKTRDDLLGSKFFSMLSVEDQEIPLSYFNSLPQENPVVAYDYKLTLPSGQIMWQQCTTRRLFDENGNSKEFQSVAQDVTRRKSIEEEIRQAEQRLRAILTAMVDGVVVMDAAGMIASFNPAAEKIFLRSSDEALGARFSEFFPLPEQILFEAYLATILHERKTKETELSASRPDGTRVPIDLAISEVYLGGARMLIAVVRDISERKKMEDQFRQSQKMEAIGRLAGGIAHDFNNLIQAIIGYTNLLLKRLSSSDHNRETIEQIEKSADRAAALTSQLLAFSRKQVFKPKLISLNAVMSDMTKLLQRLIGENIQLVTRPGDSLGSVRADPSQIEQVILNLALNARDAMPQGGTLDISTSNVLVDERLDGFSPEFLPGPYVMLTIADTGCGMTPEQKSHLFEPFFTTKEMGKGTGLGLSIVYGVIKQSGGEITCGSEVGKGTRFRIYLPRIDAPPDETAPVALSAKSSKRGETILLVEDGEIVRAMLTEVLEEQGYRVLQAIDGEDAISVASRHAGQIQLLVTDLVMPRISGRTLADRLLISYPSLRVLFISGYTDDEVIRHGRIDSASDFLQKPFRPELLLNKVRQMLDAPAKT